MMARLYERRLKLGICVKCEQAAHPYVYCEDCRADRAYDAGVRRLTTLFIGFMTSHTST
jgi:hypothetical protein